ncbi:hypothetical protein FA13DRAFT_1398019 [Coprinellus micaceus]|uniref:Uncharacterized protein n=1 Tax=Coprinellus micaceus TaxID=71717 RepID=A0A4Y7SQ39_COPMI|nr:hypothetical protein FA13DRAFT_1398019 [Coprinellus micaceus]
MASDGATCVRTETRNTSLAPSPPPEANDRAQIHHHCSVDRNRIPLSPCFPEPPSNADSFPFCLAIRNLGPLCGSGAYRGNGMIGRNPSSFLIQSFSGRRHA